MKIKSIIRDVGSRGSVRYILERRFHAYSLLVNSIVV